MFELLPPTRVLVGCVGGSANATSPQLLFLQPLTISEGGNASSTSSCGSLGGPGSGPSPTAVAAKANARLLNAIIAEKTRHLLRSREVAAILRTRQAALETGKRATDLFAVHQNQQRKMQHLRQTAAATATAPAN